MSGDNTVFIDNKQYGITEDYSRYLGYTVEFFVNDDGEVAFIRPKGNKNSELVLNADEIDGFINRTYTYYPDNGTRQKTAKVDYRCSILYNKRAVAEVTEDITVPKNGYVRLLDNDNDGDYDVVFIMSYEVMEVYSADTERYIVYDKNNTVNFIDLYKAYENNNLTVYNGDAVSEFDRIKTDSVILTYMSADGEIAEVYILDNTAEGSVTGIQNGGDKIIIDGKDYETAECFNTDDIDLSDNVKIYLDFDNRAVYAKKLSVRGEKLGYVLMINFDSGDYSLAVRILDSDNETYKILEQEKIIIDNSAYKNMKKAYDYLELYANRKLVKFSVDENETVSIITQNDTDSEYPLRVTYPKSTIQYISSMQSFYGSFGVSGNTAVFKIPVDDTENYDSYGVLTKSYFSNSESYEVEAYNLGEGSLIADAVLVYEEAEKVKNSIGIVKDDCKMLLDEDGTAKMSITLIDHTGKEQNFRTEDTSMLEGISPGDFVSCGYDVNNKLKSVSVIYDYSEKKYTQKSNPTSDYAIGIRYAFGKVFEKHGTAIGVAMGDITSETTRLDCQIYDVSLFRSIQNG